MGADYSTTWLAHGVELVRLPTSLGASTSLSCFQGSQHQSLRCLDHRSVFAALHCGCRPDQSSEIFCPHRVHRHAATLPPLWRASNTPWKQNGRFFWRRRHRLARHQAYTRCDYFSLIKFYYLHDMCMCPSCIGIRSGRQYGLKQKLDLQREPSNQGRRWSCGCEIFLEDDLVLSQLLNACYISQIRPRLLFPHRVMRIWSLAVSCGGPVRDLSCAIVSCSSTRKLYGIS